MKITFLEIVALLGLFIGAMIPVVAGIIFAVRENRRLEKQDAAKHL